MITIPAPNLRNFDWGKMLNTEKEKVIHCWTKCAVTDVPEGYVAFEGQLGSKEENANMLNAVRGNGEGDASL